MAWQMGCKDGIRYSKETLKLNQLYCYIMDNIVLWLYFECSGE